MNQEQISGPMRNRRVHMANERTFLAWIRTSVAIMGFGFVVEKFALFLRQFSVYIMRELSLQPSPASVPVGTEGISGLLGLILVGLGALMSLLAFIRYKRVERQIDNDSFQPSFILDLLLVMSILAVAAFLVLYLIHRV